MRNRLDSFWGRTFIWTSEHSELYENYRVIRGGYNDTLCENDFLSPINRGWADPDKSNNRVALKAFFT